VSDARHVWRCLRMPGSQSRSDGELVAALWALPELAVCTARLSVFAPLPPILRLALPAPYRREPRHHHQRISVSVVACPRFEPTNLRRSGLMPIALHGRYPSSPARFSARRLQSAMKRPPGLFPLLDRSTTPALRSYCSQADRLMRSERDIRCCARGVGYGFF